MNTLNSANESSLFYTTTGQQQSQLDTLYAGDIRRPWLSVYGFPTSAARLAANQSLCLHCREDEVFNLLDSLNHLLAQPTALNQAWTMLGQLQTQTHQKLLRRLELEQQPISSDEGGNLVAESEQALTQPTPQTTNAQLETILSSPTAGHEIAGLKKMLARLELLVSALTTVKDSGFHVIVQDKSRQPVRPALEARRHEVVHLDGKPTTLRAGFLLPPRYHLTLWVYQIVRSDHRHAAGWN